MKITRCAQGCGSQKEAEAIIARCRRLFGKFSASELEELMHAGGFVLKGSRAMHIDILATHLMGT